MANEVSEAKLSVEQNASLRYKLAASVQFDQARVVQKDSLSLIAYASSAGLLFVAQGAAVHLFQFSDLSKLTGDNWRFDGASIHQTADGDSQTSIEGVKVQCASTIRLSHSVVHVAANCDETFLSIAYADSGDAFIEILQLSSLARVSRVRAPGRLLDAVWNPAVPNYLATLSVDSNNEYTARFWELSSTSVKLVGSVSGATAIGFSPKGKCIVLGMQDGRLRQLELTSALKRDVRGAMAGRAVTSVAWISNFTFVVAYRADSSSDKDLLCALTIDKQGDRAKLTRFDSACVPDNGQSEARYHVGQIREWRVVLLGSSASHSLSNMAYTAPEGNELDTLNWTEYSLDDDARPELPMTEDYADTQPLGLAFASATTLSLFVLSNSGKLLRFFVSNADSQALLIAPPAAASQLNLPRQVDLSAAAVSAQAPAKPVESANSLAAQLTKPNVLAQANAPTGSLFGSAFSFSNSSGASNSTASSFGGASAPLSAFGSAFASASTNNSANPLANVSLATSNNPKASDLASLLAPGVGGNTQKLPTFAATAENVQKPMAQSLQSQAPSVLGSNLSKAPTESAKKPVSAQTTASIASRAESGTRRTQSHPLVFDQCAEAVEFDNMLRQVSARIHQLAESPSGVRADEHKGELDRVGEQVAAFLSDAKGNVDALAVSARAAKRDWLNLLVALDHVNALAALLDTLSCEDRRLADDSHLMRLMASFRNSWLEQRARRLEAVCGELADAERRLAELNGRVDAEAARRAAAQRRVSAAASQSSVREQLARICWLNRTALATSRAKLDVVARRARRIRAYSAGRSAADDVSVLNQSRQKPSSQSPLPAALVRHLRNREVPVVRCTNSDALCSVRLDPTASPVAAKTECAPGGKPQLQHAVTPTQAAKRVQQAASSNFDPDHIAALTKSLIDRLGEVEKVTHDVAPTGADESLIRTLGGTPTSLRPTRVAVASPDSSQVQRLTPQQNQLMQQAKQASVSSPLQKQSAKASSSILASPATAKTPTAPDDLSKTSLQQPPTQLPTAPFASKPTASSPTASSVKTSSPNSQTLPTSNLPKATTLFGTPQLNVASKPPSQPSNLFSLGTSQNSSTPQTAASQPDSSAGNSLQQAATKLPQAQLFGAPQTQSPATVPTSTPTAAGSQIFGNSAVTTTATPTSQSTLFGTAQSSAGSNSQQPSIFGAAAPQSTATVNPAAPQTSLFGAAAQSTASANAAPQSSLFAAPAQQTAATSTAASTTITTSTSQSQSVFGSAAQTQSQSQSIFGSASQQSSAAGNSSAQSLFGSSGQPPATSGNTSQSQSIFGNPTQQTASGSSAQTQSIFGGASQQPASSGTTSQTTQSIFGASSLQTSTGTTASTPAQSIFGAANQQTTAAGNSSQQTNPSAANSQPPNSNDNPIGGFTSLFNDPSKGNSLFGSSQPTANSSSLFGAAKTQAQTPATNNVFGTTVAEAQQKSAAAAASAGNATTNSSASGFSFASNSGFAKAAQQSTTPASNGQSLFGAAGNSTASNSLFGAASGNQSSVFGAASGQSSSLFGGASGNQPAGGLFGAASSTTPSVFGGASAAPKSAAPSLFGAVSSAQPNAAGNSLFGGAQQSKPVFGQSSFGSAPAFGAPSVFGAAPTSTFGASAGNQQPSTFGSLFAAQQQQQQQQPNTASPQPSTFGFAAMANANAPSFGNLANTTPQASAFGGAQQQTASSPSFTVRRM